MSFSRAGLPIRKYRTVISLETFVYDRLTQLLKHLILCYVLIRYEIKRKFVFIIKSYDLIVVNVSYTSSFRCLISSLYDFLTLNRMV